MLTSLAGAREGTGPVGEKLQNLQHGVLEKFQWGSVIDGVPEARGIFKPDQPDQLLTEMNICK